MKVKIGFTRTKKDSSGETYKFKNGLAVVPGIIIKGKPVVITVKEFIELNLQGERNEN